MCRVGTPRKEPRAPRRGRLQRTHARSALRTDLCMAWLRGSGFLMISTVAFDRRWLESRELMCRTLTFPRGPVTGPPRQPLLAFLISKSAAGMRVRWLLHYLSSRHERMEIGKWEKYSPDVSSMLLLEVFTNSSLRGRRTITSTAERQAWKAVSQTVLVSTLTWKTEFYHTSD